MPLGNRLFRAGNGVMILASVAFLGTLYAISLYYQDGRGLSALGSGLSTFPEAVGVMAGAQLASRALYPRLGPRRHITIGLTGVLAVDSRRGRRRHDPRPAAQARYRADGRALGGLTARSAGRGVAGHADDGGGAGGLALRCDELRA